MNFKPFKIFFVILAFVFTSATKDGGGHALPSVILKDIYGNQIDTGELSNDGKPILILFWATWCKCCEGELNTINELYEDWKDETGVKIVAVSVDDEKTKRQVGPMVDAAGWEFDFWLDPNGAFKRAMGVNLPPHHFILDGQLNITFSHSGFVPGDEDVIYTELMKTTHP